MINYVRMLEKHLKRALGKIPLHCNFKKFKALIHKKEKGNKKHCNYKIYSKLSKEKLS